MSCLSPHFLPFQHQCFTNIVLLFQLTLGKYGTCSRNIVIDFSLRNSDFIHKHYLSFPPILYINFLL